jgi:hypothetical protein
VQAKPATLGQKNGYRKRRGIQRGDRNEDEQERERSKRRCVWALRITYETLREVRGVPQSDHMGPQLEHAAFYPRTIKSDFGNHWGNRGKVGV